MVLIRLIPLPYFFFASKIKAKRLGMFIALYISKKKYEEEL